MGQVRVLGLSSAMSSALRAKRRSGSRNCSVPCRKKAKSAAAPLLPDEGEQAELIGAVDARKSPPGSRSRTG
jgi:hypothetical protein